MRCRIARRSWIDVELDVASRDERAALADHLSKCTVCRTWAAIQRDLTTDLSTLRGDAPFELDVVPSVVARIANIPPAPGVSVPARQLAWAMSSAILVGVGLLLGAWFALPDLGSAGGDARALLSGMVNALSGLKAPLMASAGVLARLLAGISVLARAVADTLRTLQPVAIATIVSCTITMAAGIALVLGRDLRRPRWIKEEPR